MFSDLINSPLVGVPGDTCTSCGSALSRDQRYCLSCGTRRSGANLHFQQILAADSAAQAATWADRTAAAGAAAGDGAATRSSMPALASIACLLLALGVGVLIGRSGGSTAAPTQAVTAAPVATGAAPDAAATAAKKTPKSASKNDHPAAAAANKDLKKLESLTPEQYQKQSLKLPKVVGTGGEPPPKDNKAPAGGGSFETIG